MPKSPIRRRRPTYFHPVPLRARADGWTVARQCGFLAHLYLTGSVTAAAAAVGMSRESAHRLRARVGGESFAQAWDRVLAPAGSGRIAGVKTDFCKITNSQLIHRIEQGLVRPVIYRGAMKGIQQKADDTALLRLLRKPAFSLARTSKQASF